MNICFVIVNYNDGKNTLKLVNKLREFNCLKEIVVVDNNSQDDSLTILKEEKNSFHLIANKENFGYAKALNMGCRYLCEKYANPYIFLSNTDIEVDSAKVLLDLAEKIDDEVKCVMPKIEEQGVFKYGWKLTSAFKDILLNIPLLNRPLRKKFIYYDHKYFAGKSKCFVDVIYGCFFLIEGKTLKEIDYFDEGTFLYNEEYILARKLQRVKKKSLIDLTNKVKHIHNVSIGSNLSQLKKYKSYKESQIYYEKNYNNANAFELIIFRLFYYLNLIPYKIKSILKK